MGYIACIFFLLAAFQVEMSKPYTYFLPPIHCRKLFFSYCRIRKSWWKIIWCTIFDGSKNKPISWQQIFAGKKSFRILLLPNFFLYISSSHIESYFLVDHCSSFELCILVKNTMGAFIGAKLQMSLELCLARMLHSQLQVRKKLLSWIWKNK